MIPTIHYYHTTVYDNTFFIPIFLLLQNPARLWDKLESNVLLILHVKPLVSADSILNVFVQKNV